AEGVAQPVARARPCAVGIVTFEPGVGFAVAAFLDERQQQFRRAVGVDVAIGQQQAAHRRGWFAAISWAIPVALSFATKSASAIPSLSMKATIMSHWATGERLVPAGISLYPRPIRSGAMQRRTSERRAIDPRH